MKLLLSLGNCTLPASLKERFSGWLQGDYGDLALYWDKAQHGRQLTNVAWKEIMKQRLVTATDPMMADSSDGKNGYRRC